MWTRGQTVWPVLRQSVHFLKHQQPLFSSKKTPQLQKMSALKWPFWQQHKTPQQSRNPWFQKTHKRITFLRVILVMQTWCFHQEEPGNEMSLLLWYAGISYSPCCRMCGGFCLGGFFTVENVTSPPHLKVLKHVFSHLQWKAGLKVLLNVQI